MCRTVEERKVFPKGIYRYSLGIIIFFGLPLASKLLGRMKPKDHFDHSVTEA